MKSILCKNCNQYVEPKSLKCPKCGHHFTLKDIIPDEEVDTFKKDQLSKLKIWTLILTVLNVIAWINGGFWWLLFMILIIPNIMAVFIYFDYSNRDFEAWRETLGGTWKYWQYQSTRKKAFFLLKIFTKMS